MIKYKKVQELTNKGYEYLKYSDGTKVWYLNGKLHRPDGPAYIRSNGTKAWWLNGKLHRPDGPAVIYPTGTKLWRLNGELHRPDGPAIIRQDGTKEWYLNGIKIDEIEFNKVLNCPLKELPLYINTELEPIVKERFKNERTYI